MRNTDIGELAETGVDSVDHRVARKDLFDHSARGKNTRARVRRNANGLAFESDGSELNKRNVFTV